MEPNAFIAEVYRRMAERYEGKRPEPSWRETENNQMVVASVRQYAPHLPNDKRAHILDVGFGDGWFMAACLKLGYSNLTGIDFGIQYKQHVRNWAPDRITLCEIKNDIGTFLSDRKEQYDFIHVSHVIEHIPKYSLLWVVDSLYWALKRGGTILLRTPNMEGLCANSSLYVTLSHEYGFAGSNLLSLLQLGGFDDVRLIDFGPQASTLKQRFGNLLRWPFVQMNRMEHRLFGVNVGDRFGSELIAIGKRGDWPPYFAERYK
jgi:2-polyprenyl-3-methyl-5-hydroxy-6-metoxy-1,4-benzoquinol methylase